MQLNRQAVKFEGTELVAGIWTVLTCLYRQGGEEKHQPRVWTRKKQRANLQMKTTNTGLIPHPQPPPQKKQGQGIVHIQKEPCKTQLRADLFLEGFSAVPRLSPSPLSCATVAPRTHCSFTDHSAGGLFTSLPTVAPLTIHPESLIIPLPLHICLARSEYSQRVYYYVEPE